ncbi:MAG TPA: HD domain-containing protein [Prolixibacteraceae bacterium]|nr:HD domain-containing protein [Prolixibacteraceae bacterium]
MNKQQEVINACVSFVKQELHDGEKGHDWWHVERVWRSSVLIAKTEPVNLLIVELAALLHDIADSKFNGGDEEIGPAKADEFLQSLGVEASVREHVVRIIRHISFKGGNNLPGFSSPELQVVQDADRLDAMGAIGIARAFHYGGYKNRLLYHPDISPNLRMTKEEYKNSDAPTINHFHEKLLLLKERMNTPAGKALAIKRHDFMEQFLDEFRKEWNGIN